MRPHTRTQCNDGKDCKECGQGGLSAASHPSSSSIENSNEIDLDELAPGQIDLTNVPQDKNEKRFEYCIHSKRKIF